MRHTISMSFFLWLLQSIAYGQLMYDWENRAENFHYRVKNIEFFIDRFNNQPEGSGSAHAANPKDTAACLAFMKERDFKLYSLFDLNRINKKDEKLKQKINAFFRDINSPYQPKFLRFEDMYWYAELMLTVHTKGQQKKLRCILQIVPLGNGALGWVIRSFHSTELMIEERFRSNLLFFPPSINGTDFMGVRLALNDPEWMGVRLALNDPEWTKEKSGKPELSNSIILKQLSEGQLKIEAISRITYHFLQLEGWIITVNYVNRESKNSGWLMDLLQPATRQEKVNYIKELSVD